MFREMAMCKSKTAKLLMLIAFVVMIMMATASSTIAFLTDREVLTYKVTLLIPDSSQSIDIALTDDNREGEITQELTANEPGTANPVVENPGDAPCYTRVRIDMDRIDGIPIYATIFGTSDNYNDADWTLGSDGWYYYKAILMPGESTLPLFDGMMTSPELEPQVLALADADMTIIAEAIAADGFTNAVAAFAAADQPQPLE